MSSTAIASTTGTPGLNATSSAPANGGSPKLPPPGDKYNSSVSSMADSYHPGLKPAAASSNEGASKETEVSKTLDEVKNPPQLINSGEQGVPRSASVSQAPKSVAVEEANDDKGNNSINTVAMKMERILQRFLVRSPHTFIAMASTFTPLYYIWGNESLAYSATTFVGVGGSIYCLVRAIFLEIIPEWMLPRTDDTYNWRHCINITYTGFLTVMFTSAVWKLPDVTATQGLFALVLTFGVPYRFLCKMYPDIDTLPHFLQQRMGY